MIDFAILAARITAGLVVAAVFIACMLEYFEVLTK
jgi:hypothetical protein